MKIGHIDVYGINKIIVGEKAVWKLIRERWVKYIGDEAKDGKTKLEMHNYLNGMYYATNPQPATEKDFKIIHRYEIGINGDTIHIKRAAEKGRDSLKINPADKKGKKSSEKKNKSKTRKK